MSVENDADLRQVYVCLSKFLPQEDLRKLRPVCKAFRDSYGEHHSDIRLWKKVPATYRSALLSCRLAGPLGPHRSRFLRDKMEMQKDAIVSYYRNGCGVDVHNTIEEQPFRGYRRLPIIDDALLTQHSTWNASTGRWDTIDGERRKPYLRDLAFPVMRDTDNSDGRFNIYMRTFTGTSMQVEQFCLPLIVLPFQPEWAGMQPHRVSMFRKRCDESEDRVRKFINLFNAGQHDTTLLF